MRRARIARIAFAVGALLVALPVAWFGWQQYQATREVRVWIGGDVHFGATTPRIDFPHEGIGIVNLEGPTTTGDAGQSSESRLVNAASGLRALDQAGVRVVGVANNHARDVEPNETAAHARAANLQPAGADKDGPGRMTGLGSVPTPYGRMVVMAYEVNGIRDKIMRRELETSLGQGAFVIAMFHVTGPPSYIPRPELRNAVEIAVEAGIRVIAAHGTHAVGPVERRPDGTVIAWGLGNLLFACSCSRETEGAILELAMRRDGKVRASIVPIVAGLDGEPARLEPDPSLMFELFKSIKSTPLTREGPRAHF